MGTYPANLRSLPIKLFAPEGQQKSLLKVEKTPMAAILFFKMRPKIFPGKILWLCIYPVNLRRVAIIFFSLSVKISPKKPKMASVRYFGSLWMTFNEELQGQISACLQRTYICIINTSHRMI